MFDKHSYIRLHRGRCKCWRTVQHTPSWATFRLAIKRGSATNSKFFVNSSREEITTNNVGTTTKESPRKCIQHNVKNHLLPPLPPKKNSKQKGAQCVGVWFWIYYQVIAFDSKNCIQMRLIALYSHQWPDNPAMWIRMRSAFFGAFIYSSNHVNKQTNNTHRRRHKQICQFGWGRWSHAHAHDSRHKHQIITHWKSPLHSNHNAMR